jgi:hypothetical protein
VGGERAAEHATASDGGEPSPSAAAQAEQPAPAPAEADAWSVQVDSEGRRREGQNLSITAAGEGSQLPDTELQGSVAAVVGESVAAPVAGVEAAPDSGGGSGSEEDSAGLGADSPSRPSPPPPTPVAPFARPTWLDSITAAAAPVAAAGSAPGLGGPLGLSVAPEEEPPLRITPSGRSGSAPKRRRKLRPVAPLPDELAAPLEALKAAVTAAPWLIPAGPVKPAAGAEGGAAAEDSDEAGGGGGPGAGTGRQQAGTEEAANGSEACA